MNFSLFTGTRAFSGQPQARFLDAKDESIMVWIPWIGAAITVALWLGGKLGFPSHFDNFTKLFVSLVFMDSVHVIWTFILLASLPELKHWSKSEESRAKTGWLKNLKPTARSAIIAVAIGAIFWVLKIAPELASLRGMATTFLMLELLGPAQHTLAQIKGISLCYNTAIRKNFNFNEAETIIARRCEKIERYLFTSLLVGEFLYWMPKILKLEKFSLEGMTSIESLGVFTVIASSACIAINTLFYPNQNRSRKFEFVARVGLFPLKILHAMGGLCIRASHGTEYWVIFKKMVDGSKISEEKKRRVFAFTFGVSVIYALICFIIWPHALEKLAGYQTSTDFLAYLTLPVFALRFTHFYVDSILFRMSDPFTRMSVGPLLTPPQPIESIETEHTLTDSEERRLA